MAIPAPLLDQVLGLPENDRRELRELLEGALGDEGDDLDDAERSLLHASIERGRADAAAGRLTAAGEILAKLRRQ